MKRRFISIRSKVLLMLAYFMAGLVTVILLDAYFDNRHDRMDLHYRGLLQQGEQAGRIQYLVEAMHSEVNRLVYQGRDDLQSRVLAESEDLIIEFDEFARASREYGFDDDYFFILENESAFLQLRAEIFRAVALQRAGKQEQAAQVLVEQIEPGIFHIGSFVANASEIRKLMLADLQQSSRILHNKEDTLELIISWTVLAFGVLVALVISRSVIKPIESLTAQVRGMQGKDHRRTRLVSAANDESYILSVAFNDLLEDYEDAKTTLARHNEILEQTINKRTSELMAAQERLLKKDRLVVLGQVTGMVSHELRNPLGAISASMYTLRKRLTQDKFGTRHILERIERNVGRCDRIVDELLIFSRSRELDLTEIDFDEWLDQLLSDFSVPDQIALKRDLGSNATLPIDMENMRGVFVNLLSNAAEAILADKDAVQAGSEIRVSSGLSAGQLICTIEDNGPGMSEEVLNQVFEPLFTTKPFGVGLGMAVVKRSVEQHGGQLELDSKRGGGTRCTIRLNIQQG